MWRGFTGATLPSSFFEANAEGVRGGIEYGFSSTTIDRAQALHYASGKASTVFEMEMGMIDRGADFSWLSQCARRRRPPSPIFRRAALRRVSSFRARAPTRLPARCGSAQTRTRRRSSSRR